jgi:hypothetical protein
MANTKELSVEDKLRAIYDLRLTLELTKLEM